ncbi:MAG: hypothetical protein H6621_02990 [Halobacteriovoraceae bacterium]|nr:hypothetical protein [Halobacteriovoraceae bacterium]MCB9094011.1 hypothetical protein [Halobacteriovoraceae bacterium]
MKEIVHISLNPGSENSVKHHECFGETFKVTTLGTDYDVELTKKLVMKYQGQCDAIALSGFPNSLKLNSRKYYHKQLKEILKIAKETPIVDGQNLRELYIPWALKKYHKAYPELFEGTRIGFFAGVIQRNIMEVYESLNAQLIFADAYFLFKIPLLIKKVRILDKLLKKSLGILLNYSLHKIKPRNFTMAKLSKMPTLNEFMDCDIYVSNGTTLPIIKTDLLKGKILIVDSIPPSLSTRLSDFDPRLVISFEPKVNNEFLGFTLMEAMFMALKEVRTPLIFDDIQPYIDEYNLAPNVQNIELENSKRSKFAFLVHPLKSTDLVKAKPLRPLRKFPRAVKLVEEVSEKIPGFYFGKITGIRSEKTGKEVEGMIYAVSETPKMLLKTNPEKFYQKVDKLTHEAKKRGADIFGLGAYTKIVGDAGVSIAKMAPLPVTTGNSLSAASTLWAANYSVSQMGFVPFKDGKYCGKVLVIGATGSIGKVTAKLLASKWKEVILVAPRPYKLMELSEQIKEIVPDAKVVYSTDANKHIAEADLIISTTSSPHQKIIDIEKVKPGAVICDVSRPFNVSEDEALLRPDVLVIASGEVELPGDVHLTCNIGLHGSVVYACLAETALLALENRFECFSLSRDLDYKRVQEIDQIARRHGVKLASIMGHSTEISDDEIKLCREHALKKRSDQMTIDESSQENSENQESIDFH